MWEQDEIKDHHNYSLQRDRCDRSVFASETISVVRVDLHEGEVESGSIRFTQHYN